MEMKNIITVVIALAVGAILLGAILPTALSSLYKVQTYDANQLYGYDGAGKAITTDLNVSNDGPSIAIFNLFPLFAVLGGMAILAGFVYKGYKG